MTYGDYLTTSEMTRWILDTDIAWDSIDSSLACSQPDLLDRMRDSALIESFFPVFTPRILGLMWDNITATAIYRVQLCGQPYSVLLNWKPTIAHRPK